MFSRSQSARLALLLFTAMAVAMLWGVSFRAQSQLKAQVLERELARSGQLAEAMGGQVDAMFGAVALSLGQLRTEWVLRPETFEHKVYESLASLPSGLVSHVTVVNAGGYVVFNSLPLMAGGGLGTYLGDRPYFRQMQETNALVISPPIKGRIVGQWLVVVALPVFRDGRFDGSVHMLVPTEFLAARLARLSLSEQDVVGLVHPDGSFMARSVDHTAAMGLKVPTDRPYLQSLVPGSGLFRQAGAVDQVARLFGWFRLQDSGLVVVVGLAEAPVLAPVVQSQVRSRWLTGALSLLLLAGGGWMYRLLWRLEHSRLAARRNEERLQQAQHMARLGYWEFDAAARRLVWSDEVFEIFGVDAAAFVPTLEAFFDAVHPDDVAGLREAYEQSQRSGVPLQTLFRIVRPDGGVCHLRLLSVSGTGPGGQPTSQGTVQDITELREAQLALEQLNTGLEQRVKKRTQELQALNQELESFTYSVSHDLRTPLRSIHGFATLLQESAAQRLDDEGRDFLRRIQESSRRMGALITDLLSMAQHSRAEMRPQWVDVSDLAAQVVAELERGEPLRKLHWDIEPGLRAWADPTLMRVVVQNLLGNAWKYTGQTAEARVSLRSAGLTADGQAAFCVQDNGAGFDMAYADQLFQPFKRLHTHQQFEGTGIGLATVARVLQRHGGRVRGEGVVGQGATFVFSLPAEPSGLFTDSDMKAR